MNTIECLAMKDNARRKLCAKLPIESKVKRLNGMVRNGTMERIVQFEVWIASKTMDYNVQFKVYWLQSGA